MDARVRARLMMLMVDFDRLSDSLLQKAFELGLARTARNRRSPKADKTRNSSRLISSKWRTKTVFQQTANRCGWIRGRFL